MCCVYMASGRELRELHSPSHGTSVMPTQFSTNSTKQTRPVSRIQPGRVQGKERTSEACRQTTRNSLLLIFIFWRPPSGPSPLDLRFE